MKEELRAPVQTENRKKARLGALVYFTLLMAMILYPIISHQNPPPGQEGVLVNLGLPDQGQGEENASGGAPEPELDEPTPEPAAPEPTQPAPEPVKETPKPKPKPQPTKPVVESPSPEELAIKRQKEREQRERAAEERRQREAKAAAEAKARAEAEAKRQKEEAERQKREEADRLKDQLGGLFGSGSGNGTTGTPGNQGVEDGDPDASKLEGISTGSGQVGGGLGNRGIMNSPRVTENSQDKGRIVLRVCVDASGKVVSAEYQQRGSTSTSTRLINAAIRNARQWKFNAGAADSKQCGTITYDFKLQ